MKREKTLIRHTIILTIGNIFPKISTFLLLPILTAFLTKYEFGIYDLVLTGTSFIFPIVTLLIEQSVFRYLLESKSTESKNTYITNTAIYILFSSILLSLISLLILKQLNVMLYGLITLYIVINLYNKFVLQVARGIGELKYYSISSIINSLISFLLILLIVYRVNFGLQGLLISIIFSMLISTIYIVYKIKLFDYIEFRYTSVKVIKKLLGYSVPLIPNSISWWIVAASDRWLITAFLGVEHNSIYAVANKIPSLINLIYSNFNLAWQESATVTSNDKDVNSYYTNIFRYLYNFLIGIIIILISISPYVFRIFVDKSYAGAYFQVPILFIAMLFHSFSSFYGGIYIALKNSKKLSTSSLIAAAINIAINVMFISSLGLYAASLSTLLAYFILTMHRAIHIKKIISIKYDTKQIIFKFLLVIIVAMISYLDNLILQILNVLVSTGIAIFLNQEIIKNILIKVRNKISAESKE
jgi:O-antigen/teichoic acid export membrane protein